MPRRVQAPAGMTLPLMSVVRTSELIPHEKLDEEHLSKTRKYMRDERVLRRPIVVHSLNGKGQLILDGHHRAAAAAQLGCSHIVVRPVDYFSEDIVVRSWANGRRWDKTGIIKDALRGRLMEPKTTRHVLRVRGKEIPFRHYDYLEPVINWPLEFLGARRVT